MTKTLNKSDLKNFTGTDQGSDRHLVEMWEVPRLCRIWSGDLGVLTDSCKLVRFDVNNFPKAFLARL
jgi:hypothetical protein